MGIAPPPNPAVGFDPAALVPDEYDVFCERCQYSLVGLTGDRCPECGEPFQPNELPYARIPWLHRRRIGRVRAYRQTVRMIAWSPRRFATELCRPTRISAADARQFRRVTLWLATGSAALCAEATLWLLEPRNIWQDLLRIAAESAVILIWSAFFHIFLMLATDMPLFIWKGLPSRPAHELAPVHHYACAPLAYLPWAALLIGGAVYLVNSPVAESLGLVDRDWATWIPTVTGTVLVLVIGAWLWAIALVLMHSVSAAPRRKVVGLALYLPVHWIIMFFVSAAGLGVCMLLFGEFLDRFTRPW